MWGISPQGVRVNPYSQVRQIPIVTAPWRRLAGQVSRRAEGRARRAERHARVLYGEARAAARVGLVEVPYRHGRHFSQHTPRGSFLAARTIGERQVRPPTWTRGCVTTFSRRSRSRMMQATAHISNVELSRSLFVTLTYPRTFPEDPSTSKLHFRAFLMRLRRKFPRMSAIWKLEFQKRGAPHWHLIVLHIPFLAKEWLSRVWYEVAGGGDERHRRAGTNVQRVVSTRQARSYVAKYVAKLPVGETPPWSGRFWGIVGRGHLDTYTVEWPFDGQGIARLTRAIRNLARGRSRGAARKFRRRNRWIFCDGERSTVLIQWAAGLPWTPLTLPRSRPSPWPSLVPL